MFAICNLAIIPLRAEPSDRSEIVSQVLFGEHFEIIETLTVLIASVGNKLAAGKPFHHCSRLLFRSVRADEGGAARKYISQQLKRTKANQAKIQFRRPPRSGE